MEQFAQPKIDEIRPKDAATNKSQEPPRDSPLVPNATPPPQGKEETCYCRPDQTPLWKTVLETAAVFLGIVVAFIYGGQLIQMIESNKLTREALIANSRAWISPMSAGFEETPKLHQPLKFGIQYGNPGRSPALAVRPVYRMRSLAKGVFDDNSVKSIIESDAICNNVVEAPGADVIYPEQPNGYKLEFTSGEPNFIEDQELFNGSKAFLLEVCFAYQTIGVLHHTSFCYYYRSGVTKETQWNVCTAGNHAD